MSEVPGKFAKQDNRKKTSFVSAFMQQGGQDAALQWLVDTKTPVCIFLITGVKFEGYVNAFDPYTISIIDVKNHQQLVYKDKISTLALKKAGMSKPRGQYDSRQPRQSGMQNQASMQTPNSSSQI